MSPKPTPKFQLPNRSAAAQDAAFRELEKRTEVRGNGIAGALDSEGKPAKSSKLRRDQRGERVAGYLPPELERELRMFCARERRSVSDALTEAVSLLLQKQSAGAR